MESSEFKTEIRVFSHSALHQFITGAPTLTERPKSTFNPYRKRPGFLSFLGLESISDLFDEASQEEQKHQDKRVVVADPPLSQLEPSV
jgi:hypothetical protein